MYVQHGKHYETFSLFPVFHVSLFKCPDAWTGDHCSVKFSVRLDVSRNSKRTLNHLQQWDNIKWEQIWQILPVSIFPGHFFTNKDCDWVPSWTMPIKPATLSFVIYSFQFYDSILEIFRQIIWITWQISSKILTGFPSDERGLVLSLLLNKSAVTFLFSFIELHHCCVDLWANF